jgi:diacylglycerol kinase (ATP)
MNGKNKISEEVSKNFRHATLALKYSFHGFIGCFKNEVAFRQEVILGVANLIAVLVIPLPLAVRLSMITLWVLLISVELLNSAIEAVVNIASPEYHELAKRAKDYGSAAVFCILALFLGGWASIAAYLIYEFLFT